MSAFRIAKRIIGPQGKMKLGHPPPILQILILKLSPLSLVQSNKKSLKIPKGYEKS
jgi:hypothetical protein